MKFFLWCFLFTFIFISLFAGFNLFININYLDNSYVFYEFHGSTPTSFDILLIGFTSISQLIFSLLFSVIFSSVASLLIKMKNQIINKKKVGWLAVVMILIPGVLYLLSQVLLLVLNEISSPLFWQGAFTSFVIVMICFIPVSFLLSWLLFKKKFSKGL